MYAMKMIVLGVFSLVVGLAGADLYGRPRVVNKLPDIGCCENPQSGVMILVR